MKTCTYTKYKKIIGLFLFFWLIIFIPKFFYFYPLTDEATYHLAQQFSYLGRMQGYFPMGVGSYLSPVADWVLGVGHAVAGYSGGYVVNLLLWGLGAYLVFEISLLLGLGGEWAFWAAILALSSEHIHAVLFTYFVDLLSAVWFLWTLYYVFKKPRSSFLIGCLFAVGLAFKLTNVIYIFSLFVVWEIFSWRTLKWKKVLTSTFQVGITFSLVFTGLCGSSMIIAWREVGDPLWPVLKMFHLIPSTLRMQNRNPEFGPNSWTGIPLWLFRAIPKGRGMSEMGRNAGRTLIYFLGSLGAMVLIFKNTKYRYDFKVWIFLIAPLFSFFLWAKSSGIMRYALVYEYLGFVPILWCLSQYLETVWIKNSARLFAVLFLLLSLDYSRQVDFGGRPSLGKLWTRLLDAKQESLAYIKRDPFEEENVVHKLMANGSGKLVVFQCEASGGIINKYPKEQKDIIWLTIGDKRLWSEEFNSFWQITWKKIIPGASIWLLRIKNIDHSFCYQKLEELGFEIDPRNLNKNFEIPKMPDLEFLTLRTSVRR